MNSDPADDLAQRVTVVLLTYNCAHRVLPVVDRLQSLGTPIVVVDNGSSDDVLQMLQRRGLRVVALPDNIGAAARNVGVEQSNTPYVALCDDDGWYERAGLRVAADLLDRFPRLAVVNARILVEPHQRLDPICAEMADSPLPGTEGFRAPGSSASWAAPSWFAATRIWRSAATTLGSSSVARKRR